MAAQANIVINDGQAAPVAHTFIARGATDKLAVYRETASGIPIGWPTVTISVKEQSGDGGKTVVDYRVSLPIQEVISGSDGGYTPSPKVAYTCWATGQFTLPNRCTLQNRKDMLAYAKNLLALTVMTAAVQDLERPF